MSISLLFNRKAENVNVIKKGPGKLRIGDNPVVIHNKREKLWP